MADTKISALTALDNAGLATGDVLPIVDTDASATKKITAGQLMGGTANGVVYLDATGKPTNSSGFVRDASGNVGIGTSSPASKLDIAWGGFQTSGYALTLGADFGNSSSRTNNNDKFGAVAMPHYTNAEEQFGLIYGYSSSSENQIVIGGGLASQNSATNIRFLTGSTNTTTTGAERMRITSAGNVGIGTSAPGDNDGEKLLVNGSIGTPLGSNVYIGFKRTGNANSGYFIPYSNVGLTGIHNDRGAGSGVYISTASLERMRVDSLGNVLIGKTTATANGGDLQVSKGITFPATQVAASDPNTLDDYEEGTFTPVLADATTGGNTAAIDTATGLYTKIGRLVEIKIDLINIDTSGMTAGNVLHIRNLPFSVSASNFYGSTILDNLSFSGLVTPVALGNTSYITLRSSESSSADTDLLVSSILSSGSDIFISITYFV